MAQANEISHVFLHPGEYIVGSSDCTVHTLLGSCVSIVLWHPRHKIGAMSHAVLPTRGNKGELEFNGRYGDEVLQMMLRDLKRAGVNVTECVAKIYGGGNMFPLHTASSTQSVGQKNGEMARRQLAVCGIPVAAESLFGEGYRKIEFDIGTGNVRVRQAGAADFDIQAAFRVQCYADVESWADQGKFMSQQH